MAFKRKSYSRRGSRSRKSYGRRKVMARARRSRLIRTIRRVALKTSEPMCVHMPINKWEMYHNTPVGFQLNGSGNLPNQGTGDTKRVGDQIYMTGWRLRLLLGQKADRPNVTFRWWFLDVPKGTSYSYGNWFDPTTNNMLLDDINKDFIKVIKSGFWRPNEAGLANAGGDEYTFAKKLWCPRKKLYKFGPADGATTHNDSDVWFLLGCYDAYGTLAGDNIAYAQGALDVFYRDP